MRKKIRNKKKPQGDINPQEKLIDLSGGTFPRFSFDTNGMQRLIILPDYSPGKGKLPVGTVTVFDRNNHTISADYIGPDIGCGMLLARFKNPLENVEYTTYRIANELKLASTELGSLGSGNHFINLYQVSESDEDSLKKGDFLTLIHTGSRLKGKRIFENGLVGEEYLIQHDNAVDFGQRNRRKLLELVEDCSGNETEGILDTIHNYLEVEQDRVIYRKGAVKLDQGELGVIPSSMAGEALLVRAKPSLKDLEWSVCHGTGRKISRSEAKDMPFDSFELRDTIYIPHFIYDNSLRTEHPGCYRTIDEILPPLEKYVEVVGRLKPLSYVS